MISIFIKMLYTAHKCIDENVKSQYNNSNNKNVIVAQKLVGYSISEGLPV